MHIISNSFQGGDDHWWSPDEQFVMASAVNDRYLYEVAVILFFCMIASISTVLFLYEIVFIAG